MLAVFVVETMPWLLQGLNTCSTARLRNRAAANADGRTEPGGKVN